MILEKYGSELILDMKGCNPGKFNQSDIESFMVALCEHIDMERADLYFWDYEDDEEAKKAAPDHLCGTTAIQFIQTSNITIHTLDRTGSVMLNIFSCKDFDHQSAIEFCAKFFSSKEVRSQSIERFA